MPQRVFVPAPPFPAAYGRTAALALGLGVFGGFGVGLFALGVPAFGWPASRYLPLIQAHGQVQTLGLVGLLIVAVGGLLLPAYWRVKLERPRQVSTAGLLVGCGLLAQLIGQPLDPSPVRSGLLGLAAILPLGGFLWIGSIVLRTRRRTSAPPAAWEGLLLVAGGSLIVGLLVRAVLLLGLARTGSPFDLGPIHSTLIGLELDGFVLAATIGVQLRLLPSLARTRPLPGWPERLGIALLALAAILRVLGLLDGAMTLLGAGVAWLTAGGVVVLFVATGLWRTGLAPTVQAPATLLPGRTRQILRVAWAGLLVSQVGGAFGLLPADAATHAFTTIYLVPLILVVGIRMLPRVSAYPIRYPRACGSLLWLATAGGVLRSFGGVLDGAAGWQLAWGGGCLLTTVVVIFAACAWSPWGVPTGVPRAPEVGQRRP